MASLKNVSVSGIATLANAADADTQPIRKAEFDTLAAAVEGNAGLIAEERELRVNADLVFARTLSILSGTLGTNTAEIFTERTLRIAADSAFASRLDLLSVTVANNTAAISSLSSVLSTVSGTISTRLDTVSASFNGFRASTTSQFLAMADANGALASRIDTITATVGENTAAITEEAIARVAADGTLSARWGVSVDINGRISGIVLNSGSDGQSTFTIRADKFELVNPSYPDNPFPSKVIGSGGTGARFQTQLGGGTPYQFTGGLGTVSRLANMGTILTFVGVGYGTGFSLGRLRFAGTNTVVVRFAGQCRNATVWHRVIGQFTDWRPLAALGWAAPTSGSGNFHTITGFSQNDISVGASDRLEIGYNGLDGNGDGDVDDDSNNDIWMGSLMVEVVNY